VSTPTAAAEVLRAFAEALPPFSAPAAIRAAARDDLPVLEAALEHLEHIWVRAPTPAAATEAIPLLALSASADHVHRFARQVLFRLPDPAGYRALVPLLRDVIDDQTLEGLLLEALGDDAELTAANALHLQYHAYGWPDRFTLSADGAQRIAAAVATLRTRASEGGRLADALARYQPVAPAGR
jgi:hypothetical protein